MSYKRDVCSTLFEMSIPILSTKLAVPPKRSDWVLRSRLIKRLNQGIGRKLTLVSAPAGFGKTTLIATWLHGLECKHSHSPRVGWLSLEDEDNDPVRFLSHFIAALQTIDPGIGLTAQSYLKTPRTPKLNHLMTLLINDLSQLPGQSVLTLDDYHVINHSGLQAAIAFFLDHLPAQVHLVITTRADPALSLPRLRGRWEVMEIRLQDLRFTHEETTSFLKRTMGLALPESAAQALEDHTEGWIAGLQMAALSLRGRAASSVTDYTILVKELEGGGQRDIIDYLAAEVLQMQSAEIRLFLQQTAILDRFNAPLCAAVTGCSNSQELLAHLEAANLFLIPLDNQRQWYRYHHLFADFLRAEFSKSGQSALHLRASQWYEENGFTPEAIKHALVAREYETAVRLIRSRVEDSCRNGAYNTLLNWVNALPEDLVRRHSDLLVHKGWILYLRGEIVTGEAYAALAVENESPQALPLHRGMLLSFRAFLAFNRDDPAQAVEYANEALKLLSETESFYRTTALSHLGQSQRLTDDRLAAIQTLRETVVLGQRLEHHLPALEALGYLALLLFQQGNLREAIQACEHAAHQYVDVRGQPLPVAALIYVPLGMLYYEKNDLERAYHFLTTGISLCQQMGIVYYALVGQRTLAKLHYAQGNVEAMWDTLASARALAVKSENQRRVRKVNALKADLELRQGLIPAAIHTLADYALKNKSRSEQENLTSVRLLMAQGQTEAAQKILQQLEQSARQQGRLGSLITIFLLQALSQQSLQNFETAQDFVAQAISLAAPEGYRRTFLDEGSEVESLLRQQPQLAPAFVTSILEAFAKKTNSLPTISVAPRLTINTSPLIEPLTATQLTILRLVDEGLSNREIATRLAITEGTTKWHLNQLYSKLYVSSRTQAIAQGRNLKLL